MGDQENGTLLSGSEGRVHQIRQELEIILKSSAFRGSKRSQLFLRHVVERALVGCEEIKERSIGVEVFGRDATYDPGDDSVVRGTARDVRSRLNQFHLAHKDRPVRIELPHGSYIPEFHWPEDSPAAEVRQIAAQHVAETEPAKPAKAGPPRQKWWRWAAVCGICTLLAGVVLWVAGQRQTLAPPKVLERFWSPLVSVPEPVLICAPAPVSYDFSGPVRKRFGTMPPSSPLQVGPIRFPPDGIVYGREIATFTDTYVGQGDAQAIARFAAMLGRMGKPFELKTCLRTSLGDLRHTPAIVIGAFDNDWSGRETDDLPFVFSCNPKHLVRETGFAKRQWIPAKGPQGQNLDDYALISRLWDPSIGQYVVLAAGIMNYGTEAAGEFLTNPAYLAEAFRNVSSNWSKQNIQIVLHVTVIDKSPGGPRVVAMRVW